LAKSLPAVRVPLSRASAARAAPRCGRSSPACSGHADGAALTFGTPPAAAVTAPARRGFAVETSPVCAGAGVFDAPPACGCLGSPSSGGPGGSALPFAFAAFAPDGGLLPRDASVDGCLRFRFGAASAHSQKHQCQTVVMFVARCWLAIEHTQAQW